MCVCVCQSPPNPLPIPSAVEQLSMDLEDAHNQVRVHQRKNASSLKDLTKQLQHYRKYVLAYVFVGVPLCVQYIRTCWGLCVCTYIFVRVPVCVQYIPVGVSVYVRIYLLGSLCMYIHTYLLGSLCVCMYSNSEITLEVQCWRTTC